MRPSESFVEQPIRDLQTMLRVLSEDDSRLPTVVPDGIYGPTTMNAVTAVQRQNGIPTTGITDQRTWETIVALYEAALIRVGKAQPIEIILDPGQVFRRGDSSPYVYLLQSMLTQRRSETYRTTRRNRSTTISETETAFRWDLWDHIRIL